MRISRLEIMLRIELLYSHVKLQREERYDNLDNNDLVSITHESENYKY